MHFNIMFNFFIQIMYEKSLKSEYISDSILFQFRWNSRELRNDRIRNIITFYIFSYLICFKALNIRLK